MAEAALKMCIVYYIISFLDPFIFSWQCLNRPIVVAPIVGLVLGDFNTGVIMGAALESIFMGISAIGGSIPADATTATVISVSYTILTGSSAEAGLAIAMPIGTVMASLSSMLTPLWASLSPYWEKLAAEGTPNKFLTQIVSVTALMPLVNTVILFFAIAYGVDGLNAFLLSLPAWVMTGLSAASRMMLAVGFAILTSMIWNKEVGGYFFLGYVLVAYLNLGSLPIAIIGTVIAITLFYSEKRTIDLKKSLLDKNTLIDNEEDFF